MPRHLRISDGVYNSGKQYEMAAGPTRSTYCRSFAGLQAGIIPHSYLWQHKVNET